MTQSLGEIGDCSGHHGYLTDLAVDQCELPLSLLFSYLVLECCYAVLIMAKHWPIVVVGRPQSSLGDT